MEASVKLTIEQWNIVLDVMSEAPVSVKRAMPLINEIITQCKAQMGNGLEADAESQPPHANKID